MESKLGVRAVAVLALAVAAGCGSIPERNPVPEALIVETTVLDLDRARLWGDEAPPWEEEWYAVPKEELARREPAFYGKEHHYLAISGGGANGAFGAGLLCGWTEEGTRPEFTMVTGISTGALAAPFAFLGPEYDAELEEVYTSFSTEDLLEKRSLLKALTSDAYADTERLAGMIASYIDAEMIEAIGREHEKGRVLIVGTTNLDAQRPVIWNITRIAASGHPGAVELIQKILLASASIPIAFPPVYIEVQAGGKTYDEMHVDGGASSQVFLYPLGIDWARLLDHFDVPGTPEVYVIRNAFVEVGYAPVDPGKLSKIGVQTIASLIRTQGIGDMFRIYLGAKRDGIDFNLTYIPEEFEDRPDEPFDPVYMRKLFDRGFEMAREGYPWSKEPYGMD